MLVHSRPMIGQSADIPAPAEAVHVVDDDANIRAALDSLFRSVGYEVRPFASVADFLSSGFAEGRGCLILDVRLPGMSGLDFQDSMASSGVTMPVILMTGHGDIPMSVRSMKAGAVDFLPKPFRDQDMLDAVSLALTRDRERQAEQGEYQKTAERFATLTLRERQVMAHVSKGLMNKQVAYELGLSEITVKIHRGNAMRKMEARSLADMVRMAEALKLDPDTLRNA